MPRTKLPKGSVPVTLLLPRQSRKILTDKAQKEAISFSELVRARRRETARRPTPAMNTSFIWPARGLRVAQTGEKPTHVSSNFALHSGAAIGFTLFPSLLLLPPTYQFADRGSSLFSARVTS